MRGNQQMAQALPLANRSIPAYAGEPATIYRFGRRPEVYPRVCGGTNTGDLETALRKGLSPRMRGNRRQRAL